MKIYKKIVRSGVMLAGLTAFALGIGANPASADPYEGYRGPKSGQVEQRVTVDRKTNKADYNLVLKGWTQPDKNGNCFWGFAKIDSNLKNVEYGGAGYQFNSGKFHGYLDLEAALGDKMTLFPTTYFTVDAGKNNMIDGAVWYNPQNGNVSGFVDVMQSLGNGVQIGPKLNFDGKNTSLEGVIWLPENKGFWSVTAGKDQVKLRYGFNF